jgi:hypothetical protein
MVPSFPADSNALEQREALIAAAQGGDARAQSQLGDLYRVGDEYTGQDYDMALRWYRCAAQQGDASAANNLGSMRLNGMGVARDAVEASRWYRIAADQGVAIAQFNLALRYLHGDGVEVSMGNLVDYQDDIEREALSGSLRAALCLAKMHDDGLGVEKDAAAAYAWLLAGKCYGCHDDDEAVRNELYEQTVAAYSDLTSAEKDEAYRSFERMRMRRGTNEHVCRTSRSADELLRRPGRDGKRTFRLMNHFSLKDSVAFIEEMTGEKMTPEGVEELRQVLGLDMPKS